MRWPLLSLAILVAGAGHAAAGDGVFEINQSCVATGCVPGDAAGLPVETAANQSYVLTSNLAAGSSAVAVTLGAGSTLDLNGFAIEGDVTCTGAPAACSQQGFNGGGVLAGARAAIRNGTIRGIRSYGIRGGNFVRVEKMLIEQNAAGGIYGSDGTVGWVIEDCQILQNGSSGISLAYGASLGTRIQHNTIYGNQYAGVQGAVGLVLDNTIANNGNLGAIFNYSGNVTGFANNQFFGNNGGNANPQMSGGLEVGTNVCATNTTCP